MSEKRDIVLAKAEQVTRVIQWETDKLWYTPLVGWTESACARVRNLRLALEQGTTRLDKIDFSALKPKISEIILFGSTVQGSECPSDVDLMVFDNGFFSSQIEWTGAEDIYELLSHNIFLLAKTFFRISDECVANLLEGISVDLHILNADFFKSWLVREEIANKHEDPDFFQNAFSHFMVFDKALGKFKHSCLADLERRYKISLVSSTTGYIYTGTRREASGF